MSHDTKGSQCAPSPPTPHLSAGELSLQPNFQKVVFDRTSTFRGGFLGKRGMTFSSGGGEGACNFCIKNKLKSEIFNDKKSL